MSEDTVGLGQLFEGEEDGLDWAGMMLLLFLGLMSLWGIALADLGFFKGPFLVGGGMILLATLVWCAATKRPRPKAPPLGDIVGLGTVLVLAIFLFFPPGQFILGGWDAGAYFNTGVSLARSGSFIQEDEYLAQGLPGFRAAFVLSNPLGQDYLMPGFYVGDGSGTIYPQFSMLLSLWAAFFALLGGPGLALYAAPVIGVLGVGYFYLLVRRALGNQVALAAGLLLAANGVQIWHAKLTLSEELVQVALFGGLLAGLLYLKNHKVLYALAAGVSLGALPLAKTEAAFVSLAAIGALLLLGLHLRADRKIWLLAAYLVTIGFAAVHYSTVSFFYVRDQLLASGGYLAIGFLLVGGGLSAVALVRMGPLERASRVLLKANGKALVFSLAPAALLGWAGVAAVGGDVMAPLGLADALWTGSFLSSLEGALLVLGSLFVLAGVKQKVSQAGWVVLLVLGIGAVLYLAVYLNHYQVKGEIPMYMWATRRLVPAFVPLMAIGVGAVLVKLAYALSDKKLAPLGLSLPRGQFVLVPLMMLVLVSRLPDSGPLMGHREYQGAVEQASALADMLPEDAVVIFQGDHAGIRLSAPLRFLHDRSAYVFWDPRKGASGLDSLVKVVWSQGKEVYFITSAPGPWAVRFLQYSPEYVGEVDVSLPEWARVSEGRPQEVGRFTAGFTLFRLQKGTESPSKPAKVFLDVGRENIWGYSILRGGFYERERNPQGTTYRWTAPKASLVIPQNLGSSFIIKMRVAGARPAGVPSAQMTAYCGGKLLGEFSLENDYVVYSLEVPEGCSGDDVERVTFLVNGWSPAAQGMGSDGRVLGVMVDWIELITFQSDARE